MEARNWLRTLAAAVALSGSVTTHALTTAGAGSVLVVPVVAQTGSYTTEVYVRNFNNDPITVNVKFYEANQSSTPGLQTCNQIAIPSQRTVRITLDTQCTLTVASHFGMLILEDAAAEKIHTFTAYSRAQTPGGNGFSVEGFPVGNFSGGSAGAIGLKRQAAAPVYQTNCFVGALGEAVDYQIQLFDESTGVQLGNTIGPVSPLSPYQMNRHLDIFAAAAAPPGDYSNIRARFTNKPGTGSPAFVAFCTVQESTFFGADFRIAKSTDANDNRQRREICYAQDTCGTPGASATNLTDVATKYVHWLLIDQPDYVKCELVSPRLADLEMQLRGPGDPFAAPVFVTSPPYSSGGDNQTSFYIFTGHRQQVNNGFTTRWYIDVGFREGGDPTVPIPYGITCRSGNGVSVPWYRGSTADTF
jgi:hypothetical protein